MYVRPFKPAADCSTYTLVSVFLARNCPPCLPLTSSNKVIIAECPGPNCHVASDPYSPGPAPLRSYLSCSACSLLIDGFKSLWAGNPNMNSLVAIGSSTSFSVGAAAALLPSLGFDASFMEEPVMLLAFVLLGRALEARAKVGGYCISCCMTSSNMHQNAALCWGTAWLTCAAAPHVTHAA